MNKLKGPIIILTLGLICVIIFIFIKPLLLDQTQSDTSDASNVDTTVTVAIDDWVGYVPLCSGYNIKRLRQQSIGLKCINDNANYEDRMDKLNSGKIDMAVAEVGSYIVEGDSVNYPGVIVAVLDTSSGGDAIIQYAKNKGINLNPSQFETMGHGLENPSTGMCGADPCKINSKNEWLSNMRVLVGVTVIEAEVDTFESF